MGGRSRLCWEGGVSAIGIGLADDICFELGQARPMAHDTTYMSTKTIRWVSDWLAQSRWTHSCHALQFLLPVFIAADKMQHLPSHAPWRKYEVCTDFGEVFYTLCVHTLVYILTTHPSTMCRPAVALQR